MAFDSDAIVFLAPGEIYESTADPILTVRFSDSFDGYEAVAVFRKDHRLIKCFGSTIEQAKRRLLRELKEPQ